MSQVLDREHHSGVVNDKRVAAVALLIQPHHSHALTEMKTFLRIVRAGDLRGLAAGMNDSPDAQFLFSIDGMQLAAGYWRDATSTTIGQVEASLLFDVSVQDFAHLERGPVTGAVIRMLPGRQRQLVHWSNELNKRSQEAQESIRREGVEFESWFSFELNQNLYLFALMADYKEHAVSTDHDDLDVDRIHRDFKKNWDRSARYICTRIDSSDQA